MKSKPKTPSIARKRILIVDDDPQVLEVFSALLEEVGYQVESADNALAAIAAIVRAVPDLILADIRMPIVGGMDLARELKSHVDSRRIPVVAFTGYDSPGMREAALKAGYDDYLPKPTDPGPFLDQIKNLLSQHRVNPASLPRSPARSTDARGK
jgi:two-component system, NtrC family, sensor kinase